MRFMFSGCSSLTELNVSNFNTSAVKDMWGMFKGCSGLKELNVSNFNTSKVGNMMEMFSGCSGLKELNVSNFNTSKVWNMREMFYHCSRLTSLDLSNFNTSEVGTSWLLKAGMGSMFSGCSSLKRIFNTNTWRCEESEDMFKGCTELRGAVKYDESKLDVTMANPETGYFRDPNKKYLEAYVLQSEDQHTLTFYYDNNRKERWRKTWDIDEKSSGLNGTRLAWAGTSDSPNNVVTKVVFDRSFKDFRPTTTDYWFSDFKALTTIEGLENLNTSAVKDMSHMFYGCSSLTSLDLSNFNISKVAGMSYMFYGCSSLTSLDLSNFNPYGVWDMSYMFYGCSSLKTILNAYTWQCRKSQEMFKGCTQLRGAVKYYFTDVTMANPTTGYFTDPTPKAYVLHSEDQHTLTFYYDNNRNLRSGKTWNIDEKLSSLKLAWTGTYGSPNHVVTKVVFDASFKDFRPTTTDSWFSDFKALPLLKALKTSTPLR